MAERLLCTAAARMPWQPDHCCGLALAAISLQSPPPCLQRHLLSWLSPAAKAAWASAADAWLHNGLRPHAAPLPPGAP